MKKDYMLDRIQRFCDLHGYILEERNGVYRLGMNVFDEYYPSLTSLYHELFG